MIKAVIFDFDGLIVDTESVWYDIFYKLTKQNFNLELNIVDFAKAVGTTKDPYFQLIESGVNHPIDRDLLEKQARSEYEKRIDSFSLRDGVVDYLQYAKDYGYHIGLASSSRYSWIENFLKKFRLSEYFDVIKSSDMVGTKKPNPKVYVETLRSLELKPNQAIALEDSLNGYKAATGAGIQTVVIPNRLTRYIDFPEESFRISSFTEKPLSEIIGHFNNQKTMSLR